jgi:hypothetical protein
MLFAVHIIHRDNQTIKHADNCHEIICLVNTYYKQS